MDRAKLPMLLTGGAPEGDLTGERCDVVPSCGLLDTVALVLNDRDKEQVKP